MSKHRWNQGGNSLWIFNFAAQVRVRIFLKDGAFLPCPKKYTPNLRHPKNPKVHANFKAFSHGFSGRSSLVWVAAFGCQYFYADQPKICKLIISVLGTSSDTTQMAPTFSGQTSHRILSAMAQP